MTKVKTLRNLIWIVAVFVLSFCSNKANAKTATDILQSESKGSALVLNVGAYNDASTDKLGYKIIVKEEIDSSDLVMANVKKSLNIRVEPDLKADMAGLLYKDCGGIVLERGEVWSLIESGDLIGWGKTEYLYFDEEAKALAKEVGTMTATINTDSAVIRSEASTDGAVLGYATKNALFELIYEVDDDWVCIAYDDYDGFVKTDCIEIKFDIDHGETQASIDERKRKEEEEKQKLIKQNQAIAADADEERLLAALIYCEAGGEPYEGKLAVGAVVMNRLRSGAYPDTIYGVIFASGQFTPAKTGKLQKVYEAGPNATCYQAAREALNGYTNVGDMTHFRRKGNKEGFIIGNHVFY